MGPEHKPTHTIPHFSKMKLLSSTKSRCGTSSNKLRFYHKCQALGDAEAFAAFVDELSAQDC